MALCCIVNWGLISSQTDVPYPNMKFRLCLIGARPNFYRNTDTSDVGLGKVEFSIYTHRFAVKYIYLKKNIGHVRIYSWRVQLLGRFGKDDYELYHTKPVFSRKQFNNVPVRPMAIGKTTNSFLGSHTKIPLSGINNSISDKLEYSKEVNQPETLMLLIIVA